MLSTEPPPVGWGVLIGGSPPQLIASSLCNVVGVLVTLASVSSEQFTSWSGLERAGNEVRVELRWSRDPGVAMVCALVALTVLGSGFSSACRSLLPRRPTTVPTVVGLYTPLN